MPHWKVANALDHDEYLDVPPPKTPACAGVTHFFCGTVQARCLGSRQAVPGSRAFCHRLVPGRRGASCERCVQQRTAFVSDSRPLFERRDGL